MRMHINMRTYMHINMHAYDAYDYVLYKSRLTVVSRVAKKKQVTTTESILHA